MMRRHFRLVLVAMACGPLAAAADDWPQLQNGPRRLGYSPERIDTPLTKAWAVGLAPERLAPPAQPIVAGGKVLIGTAMGNFHAFDAATGKRMWTFRAGGPILHTAGAAGPAAFFGCLDGCVYAVGLDAGQLLWKFDSRLRTGFSTAVLLDSGKVYIANRGGVYFALSQADGSVAWRRDVGAPILMSSACAEGRVIFGAMDMRVYALDAATGQVAWRSEPLAGAAFKDYWPVMVGEHVLIRPLKVSGGSTGPAIEWHRGPLPQAEIDKQEAVAAALEADPRRRNLFVLDARTGKEAMVVPQWTTATMNGAPTPCCLDGDGLLIMPVTLHDWRGGWGRLDLAKRRVVEVLSDGDQEHFAQRKYMRGTGNGDENLLLSAAGRLVFTVHTEEGNAFFTGVWNQDRRDWWQMPSYHAEQCFVSNTQGGGGNPVAISGGMVYHTSWNTLNARKAKAAEPTPATETRP